MIAMIMPMTTNTTIATCSQIHVGDILESLLGPPVRAPHAAGAPHYRVRR
jgi:hypothetical protein